MDNVETKLAVRNLRISFRTDGGKVQAVRDIDFDLYKGETLAIVGESGSGKSVTSRAILGILANNALKEGGEILYDGQDLMKISEEEFCKIRGDRIAMIFQDPLSSLNPIMRVGKQMTEAMLIKGKLSQKRSRKDFNTTLALLNKCMDEARGKTPEAVEADKALCKNFDTFERKHLELENAYLDARENCTEAISDIDDILFRIEKHATDGLVRDIKVVIKRADKSRNDFVVKARSEELTGLLTALKTLIKSPVVTKIKNTAKLLFRCGEQVDNTDYAEVAKTLESVKAILSEAASFDEPNFFSMGYYLTFAGQPLPEMSVSELNTYLRKYLDDNFMLEFIRVAKDGIIYSATQAVERKKSALEVIASETGTFSDKLDKKTARASAKALIAAVENGIDKLETVKDNIAYTFKSSIKAAVDTYFDGIKRNAKEEKRYAKQMASYNKKVEKGKTPDWKVADKKLVDLTEVRGGILNLIERVKAKYENDIAKAPDTDFDARAVDMVDYLKLKASGVAHKVTRAMAKARALKLMEEVGIPEPRKRYRQYPFEFSGGMRQRIVIAIALAANPDILICDEPTTALDVTIQSQILELINKVKEERQLSVIFITHDLGVVANMADRVAVMYAGKIVEIGTSEDIFYSPAHPYTWALLSSMPDLDTKEKLEAIPGTPPNMIYPPKGDAFAERNKYAMKIDFEQQPPMFKISDTHSAATWLLHPNAPKIDPPKIITDRIARMKKAAVGATAQNTDGAAEALEASEEHAQAVRSATAGESVTDSDILEEKLKRGVVDDAANGSTLSDEEQLATVDEASETKAAVKKPSTRKLPAKTATKSASGAKKSATSSASAKKTTTATKTSAVKKSGATETKSTTAKKSSATAAKTTESADTKTSVGSATKSGTTAAKSTSAAKKSAASGTSAKKTATGAVAAKSTTAKKSSTTAAKTPKSTAAKKPAAKVESETTAVSDEKADGNN